jgi:hypothetical protein
MPCIMQNINSNWKEAQSNLPKVCPVLPMDHYLKICRPTQGPLFQFRSGSPGGI